jgi:hypothetical protein
MILFFDNSTWRISVRGIVERFGLSAGRIWSALCERGCLCRDDLLLVSGLNDFDFFTGLGWLSCEGKLVVDDDLFCLGEGVVDGVIGGFAGVVWRVLDVWGGADFLTIKRLTGLDDFEVHCALGWLGREGKIDVDDCNRFVLM